MFKADLVFLLQSDRMLHEQTTVSRKAIEMPNLILDEGLINSRRRLPQSPAVLSGNLELNQPFPPCDTRHLNGM